MLVKDQPFHSKNFPLSTLTRAQNILDSPSCVGHISSFNRQEKLLLSKSEDPHLLMRWEIRLGHLFCRKNCLGLTFMRHLGPELWVVTKSKFGIKVLNQFFPTVNFKLEKVEISSDWASRIEPYWMQIQEYT